MNEKQYLNDLMDRVIEDFFKSNDEFITNYDDYNVRMFSGRNGGFTFQIRKNNKIVKTKTLNQQKFHYLYSVVYRDFNIQS